MSAFVAPQDNPESWQAVIIEGTPTPGLLAGPPQFTVSRKIDETISVVLEDIATQREEVEKRKDKSKSKALREHCDRQLAALDRRETAVITQLSRILDDTPSSANALPAEKEVGS